MKKSSDDKTLINKLVALLKKLPIDEIGELVIQAKYQIAEECRMVKQEYCERILDAQYGLLEMRGCPQHIIKSFKEKKQDVLGRLMETEIPENHIPAIPIIPAEYLGYSQLMAMARGRDGKTGTAYVDEGDIYDVLNTPRDPYYIFDVELGELSRLTYGGNVEAVERFFRIRYPSRSPLTAAEIIAACVHTNVHFRFYIYALGSRIVMDSGYAVSTDAVIDSTVATVSLLSFDSGVGLFRGTMGSSPAPGGAPTCSSRYH